MLLHWKLSLNSSIDFAVRRECKAFGDRRSRLQFKASCQKFREVFGGRAEENGDEERSGAGPGGLSNPQSPIGSAWDGLCHTTFFDCT